MKQIRIFLVSPSDVGDERNIASQVVAQELNRVFGDSRFLDNEKCFHVEFLKWETHTWPDVGKDTQDIINKQIPKYDILLGIMWKRFGTPTGRAPSGTFEEFERAYTSYKNTGKPHIMFYFRTEGVYPKDSNELEQFSNVIKFKERLEELGVSYQKYETTLSFERYVREHLIRYLLLRSESKAKDEPKVKQFSKVFISYAREDLKNAQRLYKELKRVGIEAWIDQENILPGQNWKKSIQEAIKNSKYFIALMSKASINKTGFVQMELKQALNILDDYPESHTFILPVRLDECSPNHEKLRKIHWLDLYPDWERGVSALMEVLKK